MNYGDIIEYIDGTRDLHFEEARNWCKTNGVTFDELIERRDLPKRYFQIGYPPEPHIPTQEEQRQKRAFAYQQEVDPITSHIQRLRDEDGQEEKITDLIEQRKQKVEEIKERYPYSVEETNSSNDMLTETESKVIKNGL